MEKVTNNCFALIFFKVICGKMYCTVKKHRGGLKVYNNDDDDDFYIVGSDCLCYSWCGSTVSVKFADLVLIDGLLWVSDGLLCIARQQHVSCEFKYSVKHPEAMLPSLLSGCIAINIFWRPLCSYTLQLQVPWPVLSHICPCMITPWLWNASTEQG